MKRIEPTLGDITMTEPTPAEREASRQRRRAKATYERLMAGQTALLVFFALLSGGMSAVADFASGETMFPPHFAQAQLFLSGIYLGSAYMASRRGITSLVLSVAVPAAVLLIDLVYRITFNWGHLLFALMVISGLCAARELRRSRA